MVWCLKLPCNVVLVTTYLKDEVTPKSKGPPSTPEVPLNRDLMVLNRGYLASIEGIWGILEGSGGGSRSTLIL